MLGVRAKSNGMTALWDDPERRLHSRENGIADVPDGDLARQLRVLKSVIRPTYRRAESYRQNCGSTSVSGSQPQLALGLQ